MRRALLLVAALAAVSVVGAPPRPAAADLPPAAASLVPLQAEMMLLVELGAFPTPLPPKVQAVHDEWASYAGGMDRPALLDWLFASDGDGAASLDRLVAEVGGPSPQVRVALGPLGQENIDALRRGDHVAIPPIVYEKAWYDLDERSGRGTGTVTAPAVTAPAVTAPAVTAPAVTAPAASAPAPVVSSAAPPAATRPVPATGAATTAAPAPAQSAATGTVADRSSGVGWAWPALGGATVLAAAGALALVARRRRTVATGAAGLSERAVHDLLDAGQRLTGSLDPSEVERRAVEEAVAVTRAEHGAFVRGRALHRRIGHTTTPGFPGDADLERGVVARALDAGQAGHTAGSDRAVSGDRLALLAVPTVHAGMVVGALVVARAGDRPFTTADGDSLGRLAPLVATALDAAARHTDAAELALVDALTAVGNRRRLERDLPGTLVGNAPVGLVMVDVDHFKRFNDTFGHPAGDEALRLVAAALSANVRDEDVVYRYGGEEFCVLLPNASTAEALEVAERLRLGVAAATALSWGMDPRRALTVSVGVAVTTDQDGERLVSRADHALYAAKHGGRDRVVVAD